MGCESRDEPKVILMRKKMCQRGLLASRSVHTRGKFGGLSRGLSTESVSPPCLYQVPSNNLFVLELSTHPPLSHSLNSSLGSSCVYRRLRPGFLIRAITLTKEQQANAGATGI